MINKRCLKTKNIYYNFYFMFLNFKSIEETLTNLLISIKT